MSKPTQEERERHPLVEYIPVPREDWEEALELIDRARGMLHALGLEFTGPRFTDRGGYGPDMLQIADDCSTFLEKHKERP